jgi:hypothetical protein
VLVFEYVFIDKTETSFEFIIVADYIVDPVAGTVVEHKLDERVSVHAPHAASPLHEGARPGSYAPLHG